MLSTSVLQQSETAREAMGAAGYQSTGTSAVASGVSRSRCEYVREKTLRDYTNGGLTAGSVLGILGGSVAATSSRNIWIGLGISVVSTIAGYGVGRGLGAVMARDCDDIEWTASSRNEWAGYQIDHENWMACSKREIRSRVAWTIGLWLGGGALGAMVGASGASGDEVKMRTYGGALVGAAAGLLVGAVVNLLRRFPCGNEPAIAAWVDPVPGRGDPSTEGLTAALAQR